RVPSAALDLVECAPRPYRLVTQLARDHEAKVRLVAGPELELELHLPFTDRGRLDRAAQPGSSAHAVEPLIAQHDLSLADLRRERLASLLTLEAPDLEDVDVVRGELDRHRQTHSALAEVRDADLLEAFTIPQQRAAEDVEIAARRDEPVAVVKIDVRKIHGEDRGIVRDAGVEQQRPKPANRELEAREKTSVPAVQPVSDVPVRVHVADAIEYRERFALLQDT